MDFTVIICTYNRAKNLPQCVDHLARQQDTEEFTWEVLIVDNNSSDETREVVTSMADKYPMPVLYAFEPQQGLNYARNTGVKLSEGRYFCYVDDDILVSPDWLSSLYHALEDHDADAVGGRIHLDPNIQIPPWIPSEAKGFLGFQDFGEESFQMDGITQYPFGGNMSFNRRVVEKIGVFNPKLGRKGEGRKRSELFKGAETDYFHRLAGTENPRIFYEPRAIVYHQVLPHQLEKKYFLTLHYNAGQQKAFHDEASYQRSFLGIPLFIFPQFMRSVVRYLALLLRKGPDQAFRQLMTIGHFLGMISGYHKAGRAED
jgi:glycosyltransferase involved in cell wall biosynthesis